MRVRDMSIEFKSLGNGLGNQLIFSKFRLKVLTDFFEEKIFLRKT